MRRKHWIAVVVAVLIVALASIGLTYRYLKLSSAGPPVAETRPLAPPLIAVSQPVMRSFSRRVPWTGVVQSQASVRLTALVAGRVEAIEARDQEPIEAGAVVMQLGGPGIEAKRAQLQTGADSLESQLDLARQTVERLRQNLEEQLTTQDQVAAAQETQLKLQAQLRDAQLALESFEKQPHIAAPMAGIFTNRRVSLGQMVSAGDVVGEIIGRDHLRIVASLFPPEGIALEGKEAAVRFGENQDLNGIVRHALPQASDTGATAVWIEGPQVDQRLRPGQTVSGEVTVEAKAAALAVPESAIVYDVQEQPYVFVQQDGTYERHSVRLGLTQEGWVEVLSGLERGQSVVTQGGYELFYREFNRQFKVED